MITTVDTRTMSIVLQGREISLASLETVNYAALLAGDSAETAKLVRASQGPGFFYLSLSGTSLQFNGNEYLNNLRSLYEEQGNYFSQSLEEKLKDHVDPSVEKGFQHYPDCETLEIPYDSFLAGQIPSALNTKAVNDLIPTSQTIVQTIVRSLAPSIASQDVRNYVDSLHIEGEPSGSGLKLENVPTVEKLEDVPPSEHTDGGSITLLFCDDYTTELQDTSTGEWKFIQPRSDCAIVNVANSLQKASHGQFKSPLHRVGQPTEGAKERRCVLYYLRPRVSSGLYGS